MVESASSLQKVADSLTQFDKDCAITVALKVTDKTCKMSEEQKALFFKLYLELGACSSEIFDAAMIHELIAKAQDNLDEYIDDVGDERERAMEIIGRPKMKAFKAMVRERLEKFEEE